MWDTLQTKLSELWTQLRIQIYFFDKYILEWNSVKSPVKQILKSEKLLKESTAGWHQKDTIVEEKLLSISIITW